MNQGKRVSQDEIPVQHVQWYSKRITAASAQKLQRVANVKAMKYETYPFRSGVDYIVQNNVLAIANEGWWYTAQMK